MNKQFSKILGLIVVMLITYLVTSNGIALTTTELTHQPLIAHAGGHIYGYKYTNSLEAIENSYNNGFKFIELDFEWTTDNEIVLIHDWAGMVKRLFMIEPQVLSYKAFMENKKFQDLTLLDFDGLAKWLEDKEDLYIVTDVKSRNYDFLEYVKKNYSTTSLQLIPQIYTFDEYEKVRELGYENIILTLYRTNYTEEEILDFVRDNSIFAITMPLDRGYSELPMKVKELGIKSYVHTVNDLYIYEELESNGVYGIYTDYFEANKWIE